MRLGPYEVLEVVGRGGMGVVHRARHAGTGQVVAIKILTGSAASEPSLLRRFERECAAAQRVIHPALVQGLDFRTDTTPPYLIMEFVEGSSLEALVRARGPLPEAEGVSLAAQIAVGLHAAHEAGLIHRDLKPDNILVTPEGKARLTDLGLVKILDEEEALTRSGAWLGTIVYMAPEQFGDARDVDPRADVYGLAATLYRTLTGAIPFPDRGGLTVLGKKLRNDFVPPRQLNPLLSEGVDRVIRQGMDATPANRPENAREFARLLVSARATSQPPTPPRSLAHDERRHARRFPSLLALLCRPLAAGTRTWRALVQDISTTGIRLALDRRFEAGTLLTVWLEPASASGASTFLVKVRWTVQTGTGRWEAGCQFTTPLASDDLASLLGDHPPTVQLTPWR